MLSRSEADALQRKASARLVALPAADRAVNRAVSWTIQAQLVWVNVEDPARRIASLVRARADVDEALSLLVDELRQSGASWSDVGAALGVSKQAAAKRYGAVPARPLQTETLDGL